MKKPRLPTLSTRKNPSGKTVYRINYFDPWKDKRIQIVVGTRKADAIKEANRVFQEMMDHYNGEVSPVHKLITIEDLIEAFFRTKENRIATSSIRRYRNLAANFLSFMKSAFPLAKNADDVKRNYLEEFLRTLYNNGQAPKTINAELQFLKALFKYAVDEGYINQNPAQRINRYRNPQAAEKVEFWDDSEVKQILDSVKPYWRDPLEFLYHTGLRKGELIHLTWDDVTIDEDKSVIKVQAKDGWTPKTNQERIVPLNSRAVEILRRQTHSSEHNWVFKGKTGGQIHRDKIYRALKGALNELGLTGNVHKFRHTFASHLVMKGVGIETVSKLLGHSTIEMTMKYAHLAPDHLRKAVDLLIDR